MCSHHFKNLVEVYRPNCPRGHQGFAIADVVRAGIIISSYLWPKFTVCRFTLSIRLHGLSTFNDQTRGSKLRAQGDDVALARSDDQQAKYAAMLLEMGKGDKFLDELLNPFIEDRTLAALKALSSSVTH
jgi:hypothetical protein